MASTYTTQAGDMWDEIAYRKLGSESYMGNLLAVNPDYADQWKLESGVVLTIPDIEEEDTSNLPPWRQ